MEASPPPPDPAATAGTSFRSATRTASVPVTGLPEPGAGGRVFWSGGDAVERREATRWDHARGPLWRGMAPRRLARVAPPGGEAETHRLSGVPRPSMHLPLRDHRGSAALGGVGRNVDAHVHLNTHVLGRPTAARPRQACGGAWTHRVSFANPPAPSVGRRRSSQTTDGRPSSPGPGGAMSPMLSPTVSDHSNLTSPGESGGGHPWRLSTAHPMHSLPLHLSEREAPVQATRYGSLPFPWKGTGEGAKPRPTTAGATRAAGLRRAPLAPFLTTTTTTTTTTTPTPGVPRSGTLLRRQFSVLGGRLSSSLLGRPETVGATAAPQTIATVEDAIRATRTEPSPMDEGLLRFYSTPSSPGVSLFALFGTLERVSRFVEFGSLYRTYEADLVVFLEQVRTHLHRGPRAIARVHTILMHLLTHPEENHKVREEFYSDPVNAWPLHTLYMTCCFYVTARRCGYAGLFAALQQTGGIMAVGKSLFAALAVAMAGNEAELAEHTARMYVAAFYVGIVMRRQQDQVAKGLERLTNRNFALLLVNIPMFTLRALVDVANHGCFVEEAVEGHPPHTAAPGRRPPPPPPLPPPPRRHDGALGGDAEGLPHHAPARRFVRPHSTMEITRVLSSRSGIVCGHPLDLQRLDIILTAFADFNGVKIHKDYLPTTVPENSSYYNRDMPFDLLEYWETIGVTLCPESMRLPVYSPVNGEVWSAETLESGARFSQMVAEAATCRNQDLTYSLQHMADGDVLLDFSAHALGIGPLIAWTAKDITILSVPSNRKGVSVLPPPHRSPQRSAILGTLHKMALINETLRTMYRQGTGEPHAPLAPIEMSTSFEGLGLLRAVRPLPSAPGADLSASSEGGHLAPFDAAGERSVADYGVLMPSISSYPTNNGLTEHFPGYGRGLSQPLSPDRSATVRGRVPTRRLTPSHLSGDELPSSERLSRAEEGQTLAAAAPATTTMAAVSGGARGRPAGTPRSSSPMKLGSPMEESPAGSPQRSVAPVESSVTRSSRYSAAHMATADEERATGGRPMAQVAGRGVMRLPSPLHRSVSLKYMGLENPYFGEDYVVQRNSNFSGVINVYQVSPLIKYYEMQSGCVLEERAVRFSRMLSDGSKVKFPPHILLICPTVFALLELWDGYEFIEGLGNSIR